MSEGGGTREIKNGKEKRSQVEKKEKKKMRGRLKSGIKKTEEKRKMSLAKVLCGLQYST